MAAAGDRRTVGAGAGPARIVATDGSATHPVPTRLARNDASLPDLADALHLLCALYGRHPGVVDHALTGTDDPQVGRWLTIAAAAFADERAYLVRLAAAAGPLPSTPGQAATEATITAQRHAIDMLAQSVRPGCALGAAGALVLDWPAIRRPLDAAAARMGIEPAPLSLPAHGDTLRLIETLATSATTARAMTFGMQQLLAQHRGLWDLLGARAEARG